MVRSEKSGTTKSGREPERLNSQEFATLFRQSFRIFHGVAIGVVGDADLAEDVVQEAAMQALGKLDAFAPGTNFTAWMAQMVRYVALNHARKERKRRPVSIDPSTLESATVDSDGAAGNWGASAALSHRMSELDQRIVSALAEASESARACLLLRIVEGLEYSEIASLLDIPLGTAMSHVHRTKKYLRARLTDLSIESMEGDRHYHGERAPRAES
jgi:RNA polymerase sigma-70 factor (ECF subfamily)